VRDDLRRRRSEVSTLSAWGCQPLSGVVLSGMSRRLWSREINRQEPGRGAPGVLGDLGKGPETLKLVFTERLRERR
jgi:hypothetical protein